MGTVLDYFSDVSAGPCGTSARLRGFPHIHGPGVTRLHEGVLSVRTYSLENNMEEALGVVNVPGGAKHPGGQVRRARRSCRCRRSGRTFIFEPYSAVEGEDVRVGVATV